MTPVPAMALLVVVPCHDEEDVPPEFIRRVEAVLGSLSGTSEISE